MHEYFQKIFTVDALEKLEENMVSVVVLSLKKTGCIGLWKRKINNSVVNIILSFIVKRLRFC